MSLFPATRLSGTPPWLPLLTGHARDGCAGFQPYHRLPAPARKEPPAPAPPCHHSPRHFAAHCLGLPRYPEHCREHSQLASQRRRSEPGSCHWRTELVMAPLAVLSMWASASAVSIGWASALLMWAWVLALLMSASVPPMWASASVPPMWASASVPPMWASASARSQEALT